MNNISTTKKPVGMIMHIGAGVCSELAEYQKLDPEKIVLIEADKKQVECLKRNSRSIKKIDVLACAISAQKEQKTLHTLSNKRDSSLLLPEGILERYPSLAITAKESVNSETLDNVLANYPIKNDQENILILEVQGLENQIIKASLVDNLQKFDTLIIRSPIDGLYKTENSDNESCLEVLKKIGFDCIDQQPEVLSSIFIKSYYQRNNAQIELTRCHKQLTTLTQERDTQTKLAAERQSKIGEITQAREVQAKAIEEQKAQNQQLTTAKEQQEKLAAERQGQIEKLTQARDAQAKAVEEQKAQNQQLTTAKEQQQKLATERQGQIEKLTQERDTQTKLAAEHQAKIGEITQAQEAQAKAIEEQQAKNQQLSTAKEQQKLATERQGQIEKLTQECDAQTKLSSEERARIDSLTAENDQKTQKNKQLESSLKSYQQEIETQKTALSEARQSTQLSLKLQMLKEADLKDLQTRYQEIQEINENQHKLLDQLSERLQMAAQYFHELSDKNKALEDANKKQKKIPWFSRKRFFLKHNNDQAET